MKNAKLETELTKLHKGIDSLSIPTLWYGGVVKENTTYHVLFISESGEHLGYQGDDIFRIISIFEKQQNAKIVAFGVPFDNSVLDNKTISTLWLEYDIVVIKEKETSPGILAQNTANEFDGLVRKVSIKRNEVLVPFLFQIDAYRDVQDEGLIDEVRVLASRMRGEKVLFINATPRGGGVAIMRHSLMRVFHELGVDASWLVLPNNPEIFKITKFKFHNVLQGVAAPETVLTNEDKELYLEYIKQFFNTTIDALRSASFIVIDDPQPSGLIPLIKQVNPSCKIIYRSHIEIVSSLAETIGTQQSITWNFIFQFIKNIDVFVSHPIKEFVSSMIPQEKVRYMPATTDPLDGLNKRLSEKDNNFYMQFFNKLLILDDQQLLDQNRPYLIQIARFDPSKGIEDVIGSYVKARMKLDKSINPQLVIAGNGSIDDPDGLPVLQLTKRLVEEKYHDFKDDIKILQLPAIDQLLNALLQNAKVAFQLSHREGFEVKVTESLMKGVPIIAYNTGGIPLQIKDKVSGFLVEKGDTEQVSNLIVELLTDKVLYKKIQKGALENINPEVNTVVNTEKWMRLFVDLS